MSNPSDQIQIDTVLATFTLDTVTPYVMETRFDGNPVTLSSGFLGGVQRDQFDSITSITSQHGRVSFRFKPELDTDEAKHAVISEFLKELDLICRRFESIELPKFRGYASVNAGAVSAKSSNDSSD